MTALASDPLATLVHQHIAELRREAAAGRTSRTARTAGTARTAARRPSWPEPVARALREMFNRPAAQAACPTC